MSPTALTPELMAYKASGWKPITEAEMKTLKQWSGMDALIGLNGHVLVRNSEGHYDRWRGGKHKPGDAPK